MHMPQENVLAFSSIWQIRISNWMDDVTSIQLGAKSQSFNLYQQANNISVTQEKYSS